MAELTAALSTQRACCSLAQPCLRKADCLHLHVNKACSVTQACSCSGMSIDRVHGGGPAACPAVWELYTGEHAFQRLQHPGQFFETVVLHDLRPVIPHGAPQWFSTTCSQQVMLLPPTTCCSDSAVPSARSGPLACCAHAVFMALQRSHARVCALGSRC